MKVDILINELSKFSDSILDLNGPVEEKGIFEFEKKYQLKLPEDYKEFIKRHDGFELMGVGLIGITPVSGNSLDQLYHFEHEEVGNPMPPNLVPFSPDGLGNHYCFDINSSGQKSCDIVFWQHDYNYDEEDLPDVV